MPKPVTLITALNAVVNDEGVAVNVMLARLDEQNVKIRKQQQVISALQFRHLLEHLPRALRGKRMAAAGNDAAAEAKKWDAMNEVERWLEFWKEAVKEVFDVFQEHETPYWTPDPDAGGVKRKPSPFAALLETHLAKAAELGRQGGDPVSWLASETDIGHDVKKLYSTLSKIIHQFSDGEFIVDRLTLSPDDARLLEALVPEKSTEEILDLRAEFRRYIWTSVENTNKASTASTARPRAGSKVSDKAILSHVETIWMSLRSKSPVHEALANRMIISSTESKDSKVTVTLQYEPAATDMYSDHLHSYVLAALFDLVGGVAVLAADEHAIGKRFQVDFTNLGPIKTGDKIDILSTASQEGKKKQLHWSAKVLMQSVSTNGEIAKGYFKIWPDRP